MLSSCLDAHHRNPAGRWDGIRRPPPTRAESPRTKLSRGKCCPHESRKSQTYYAVQHLVFQSSPDPKVGRYDPERGLLGPGLPVSILARPEGRALLHHGFPALTITDRFQSSPDPKVGRYTRLPPACGQVDPVSILARPEGRALHAEAAHDSKAAWFQSSPDPKVGRYRSSTLSSALSCCFNPRPTRRSGATWCRQPHPGYEMTFQSSPDPKVGRYRRGHMTGEPVHEFQSSPDPKVGRYVLGEFGWGRSAAVSILARPEGRALLLPAGDGASPGSVSILARPEGRALHAGGLGGERDSLDVSILARPEGRALRGSPPNLLTISRFQSSPDPKVGRYWIYPYLRQPRDGFNPRPTRRSGATCCAGWSEKRLVVSILARPEGRALRPEGGRLTWPSPVSILARPEGRALHSRVARVVLVLEVSILARPEGRALRGRAALPQSECCFNPRPTRRSGATACMSRPENLRTSRACCANRA